MKHIWTELGRVEHEARNRQYTQGNSQPGWFEQAVFQGGSKVGMLIASVGKLGKKQAPQPEYGAQNQRITGEYSRVSGD